MTEDVILFECGEDIADGDIFRARVDSIEGHRRVTLVIQKDPLEGRVENDLVRKDLLEESQTPVYCGLNHSHSKDCMQ